MAHDTHSDGHGDADGHGIEMPHVTKRDYVTGFILAGILTVIPFGLVMAQPFSTGIIAAIVVACAVAQIVVHMVYFLHMNPKAEDGWTMTSLLFTLIVVVIMLAGSIWVMHHLNTNMMPGSHDNPAFESTQTP